MPGAGGKAISFTSRTSMWLGCGVVGLGLRSHAMAAVRMSTAIHFRITWNDAVNSPADGLCNCRKVARSLKYVIYRGNSEELQMRSIFVTLVAVQLACVGAHADRSTTPGPATVAPGATEPAADQAAKVKATPPSALPASAGVKAFQDRVAAYIQLRDKVDNGIPKLTETSDPKKIAEREKALGDALIKARMGAKLGDVFAPEFQPILVKIIKDDFAKRTLAERKALVVELPKGVKFLGINNQYPTTIPLATFPPNLLMVLPDLPQSLEYRIVFRNLILRDVRGNYVIDMVPDIFPIPV
jgi:hypothetical protein